MEVVSPEWTTAATKTAPAGQLPPSKIALALYGVTFFTSAFLLFQVQLIISKYYLPWFGGTPAVFTTCMLFFQLLLLFGYAYAQALTARVKPRTQMVLHVSLLALALVFVVTRVFAWGSPLLPDASWKPLPGGTPLLQIMALLFASVALPYFVLSITGPLLQAWFGRRYHQTPYRWYALSNAGSLLGLLTYPFVFEPGLTLRMQANVWFVGFAVFAAACALVAFTSNNQLHSVVQVTQLETFAETVAPSLRRRLTWLLLSACGSLMLLATTNQMCQDIAAVPMLWVLPLSLYLLSFILCFDSQRWYSRLPWSVALGLGTILVVFALYHPALPPVLQLAICSFVLFAACMVCHGELAGSKPATAYLTTFYMIVAAGGALGGIIITIGAPFLFKGFWEFPLSLWLCCATLCALLLSDSASWIYRPQPWLLAFCAFLAFFGPVASRLEGKPITMACSLVGTCALVVFALSGQRPAPDNIRRKAARFCAGFTAITLGVILAFPAISALHGATASSRSFYGVLAVSEVDPENPEIHARQLSHGITLHGFQYVAADKRHLPTGYYAPHSGIGVAISNHPARLAGHNLRIGVVGLGVGTIAAYGRPGDSIRFYEINPDVLRMAAGSSQSYFTYLSDSKAQVDVILGDARISMERELKRNEPQRFDVLAVDAFSGDAIPLHLLTAEAFNIYTQQLRDSDSVLAFHISNRALDLSPAIARMAEQFGYTAWLVDRNYEKENSVWVIVSRHRDRPLAAGLTLLPPQTKFPLWTDDYSNLLTVLRR